MSDPHARFTTIFAIALSFLAAQLQAQQHCGKERWSVKTGTDPDAASVNLASPQNTTIAQLAGLPAPNPIPPNSRFGPTEDTVFVALDNVSRRGEGFGTDQLSWLEKDLNAARAAKKIILVGMHKGLANNPVTTHAMNEDGPTAIKDSTAALALFKKYKVAVVLVSHSHMYAAYNQDGIEVRLTGGLGAPLVKGLRADEGGFHHFLLVDVPPGENKTPLQVEVVKFQGKPTEDSEDESKEVE